MDKNFYYDNDFNIDNAFTSVKFGYDMPILETDLNEMQEIQTFNRKSFINKICKSGIIELVDKDFKGEKIVYNPNGERNKIIVAPMRAVINGYELHIKGNYELINKDLSKTDGYIEIDLGEAPAGNIDDKNINGLYRDDFVYLQFWFEELSGKSTIRKYGNLNGEILKNSIYDKRINKETTRRMAIRWKICIKKGVDFSNWENGFGYNSFNDYSDITADIHVENYIDKVFKNATHSVFKGCEFYGDNNLWVAGKLNTNNPSMTKDKDLVFAIPLYKVTRRNKKLYSLKNPNGSIDFNHNDKNLRPDNKCFDMIYPTDVLDLRKNVIINNNYTEYYLDNTLRDIFNGQLMTKENKKMKRLQLGVKPIPINTNNLIFSDSFDLDNNPRLGNKPIISTKDNSEIKYVPSVTKWGVKIDGKCKINYEIKDIENPANNINANNGTIEFFLIPNWSTTDETEQTIFTLKDEMGHNFITMKKKSNKLVINRYHDYRIEGILDNPIPEPINIYSGVYALLSNRVYHIRIIWDANSDIDSNIFAVYINGKIIAETVAYDALSLMNITKLQIGDIEDIVYPSTGFIIDELNIFNKRLSNTVWNLPEDYLKGDAIIMPSFNGLFRNFRDNEYEQQNIVNYKVVSSGDTFEVKPPYNLRFGETTPEVYCINKHENSPEDLEEGYKIEGTWEGLNENKNLKFKLNDKILKSFNGERLAIKYSLIIKNDNKLDDIPNEILKAEVYNYNTKISNEISFNEENNYSVLNEPRKVEKLLTTTINNFKEDYEGVRYLFDLKDVGFDFSTFRNEHNQDFAFSRLLEYYVTGNGTNEIPNLPSELYGYKVLYIRNVYFLNNTMYDNSKKDTEKLNIISCKQVTNQDDKMVFNIKLNRVLRNGDKIKLEIALGGLVFDYNNISKTIVGNICKADYLEFTTTGDRSVYTIPVGNVLKDNGTNNITDQDDINRNGVILSLGKSFEVDPDDIEKSYYICFRNGVLYKYEYVDGINKPFLKIKITQIVDGFESQLPIGEKIQIPVLVTHQPSSEDIVSIWYNCIPYQGILSNNEVKLKRVSKWKYFITTFSSSYVNDKFNKAYSISNVINRLPGGLTSSLFIKGQDIDLKAYRFTNKESEEQYEINKKLIFIGQSFIGNTNDDIDKHMFDLDVDYIINKVHGKLQDDIININNKEFKIYLPECSYPINKYCGMASVVMDEYGDLYLLVIGDTNNNIPSLVNSITPKYADLFIIPNRPSQINRN